MLCQSATDQGGGGAGGPDARWRGAVHRPQLHVRGQATPVLPAAHAAASTLPAAAAGPRAASVPDPISVNISFTTLLQGGGGGAEQRGPHGRRGAPVPGVLRPRPDKDHQVRGTLLGAGGRGLGGQHYPVAWLPLVRRAAALQKQDAGLPMCAGGARCGRRRR